MPLVCRLPISHLHILALSLSCLLLLGRFLVVPCTTNGAVSVEASTQGDNTTVPSCAGSKGQPHHALRLQCVPPTDQLMQSRLPMPRRRCCCLERTIAEFCQLMRPKQSSSDQTKPSGMRNRQVETVADAPPASSVVSRAPTPPSSSLVVGSARSKGLTVSSTSEPLSPPAEQHSPGGCHINHLLLLGTVNRVAAGMDTYMGRGGP